MSYFVDIGFKQVAATHVVQEINAAVQTLNVDVEQIVQKYIDVSPTALSMGAPVTDAEVEAWLYNLLTLQFVHWRERDLLGILGVLTPDDYEHIVFRDELENVYDLNAWPKCFAFDEMRHDAAARIQHVTKRTLDTEELKAMVNTHDKALRHEMYELVFERLQVADIIAGKLSGTYYDMISVNLLPMQTRAKTIAALTKKVSGWALTNAKEKAVIK